MLLLALLAPLWTDGQLPSPDLYAVVDRPHANKSGTPPYPQVYSTSTITRWNLFTRRDVITIKPHPENPKPLKIALVNMPFGVLNLPAFGCIRLQGVLEKTFGPKIQVNTHYLNIDYALQLGDLSLYNHFISEYGFMSNAGDWLFRQAAFPATPDNTEEYFARYYADQGSETLKIRTFLQKQRAGLNTVMDGFIDRYRLLEADIVGFVLLYCQTISSFALARRLKERKPSLTTIIGGPACDGEMGQAFAELIPQVDFVFCGPSLVSMPHFVKHRLAHDFESCHAVNGVLSKANQPLWASGKMALTGDDLDINANLIPDYGPFLDLVEKSFPKGEVKPVLLFETSRGCPRAKSLPCKFCGLNGTRKDYDVMTPENAIAQIKALSAYPPRASYFVGLDNLLPGNYLKDVFPALPPRSDIQIRYEVFPNLAAADLEVLCRAGVVRCQPGLESLSTTSLKLMQKGTTSFRNLQFLKDCSRYPFRPEWNLLINIPGEQDAVYEKYLRDLPLLTHLPPPAGFFPIMYVRFSGYFYHQAEHGLDLQPQDFYRLIYPFDKEALRRIAYFFSDRNIDTQRVDGWLDRLNRAASYWQQRWFNTDHKTESRLCFYKNSAMIYDSRSGTVVEHQLTRLTKNVLLYLEKPASRADLGAQFRDVVGFDMDRELESLFGLGLLFQDDGRFMSLITE
jgi:magnesium-protoporphyrin IX monomethyl ester (oxidative) cyclase